MNLEYDIRKLNTAARDFYNATGINLMLIKPDFSIYEGLERFEANRYCSAIHNLQCRKNLCKMSDFALLEKCKKSRKSEMHICHAGLIDVAVPLIYDNTIIGYIILGQMRKSDDFSLVEPSLRQLNLDSDKMKEYYLELPLFDETRIKSIENLAIMLAKYILFENMIKPDTNTDLFRITEYISRNLDGNLSIQSISRNTNISKSSMYKIFHDNLNCTVSGYISTKRVEKAIELLESTTLSIDVIAARAGFSSTTYFTRTFKTITGTTPGKYRKNQRACFNK